MIETRYCDLCGCELHPLKDTNAICEDCYFGEPYERDLTTDNMQDDDTTTA